MQSKFNEYKNMSNYDITTDTSSIAQIERAQIDMQIATARRYPRSLSKVKSNMLSFATLDEETAAGCFYTLPGRRGGDGKPLQGPSVRLAEIALSCYQHLRAGSRIIEDDGKFITAQGVVHDLENNVVISIEVKRRVTTKQGDRYGDDMIATTGNAACSIALRNAAFRVIPMALVKPVYEAAKRLAIGDGKSLVQRRASSVEHFAKLGISKEQVCKALGVRATDDIQLQHLEILIGYATAIKDGDTSVDEIFKAEEEKKELPKENPFKRKPDSEKEAAPQPTPEAEVVTKDDDQEQSDIEARNEARFSLLEAIKETAVTPDTFFARSKKAGWTESNESELTTEEMVQLTENAQAIADGVQKGGAK